MTNIHTISSSVTAFLDLLSQADAVMADSSPLLISWDVTEPTGSPSNELVRLRWEDGGLDYALVLTEEGIAAGRWQGDKYLCMDAEGDEVEITLCKLTPLKPTMCKQCGSHLDGGYCSDETCVFSDWPQSVESEDLSVFATDEIEEKYGVQKRAATALRLTAEGPPMTAPIFTNLYNHENCPAQPGVEWEDRWSCMCNDTCPACGAEVEPYDSIEH